jgi:hypothetical protein
MTGPQKILIIKLLTGHYLVHGKKRNGKDNYYLYDAKGNVLTSIRARTVDKIDKYIDPEIKIWKKSKHGQITLNLSMVRQLHGKHTIKKLYKQREQLMDPGFIYKSRNKKIKTATNEKALYLF